MEKVINIDGREIKLKATGAFLLKYRMEFQSDPLKDIMRMAEAENDLEKLDMSVLYQIFYTMAKSGNPDIEPMMDWLDGFDCLPMEDILPPVMELLSSTMGSIKKK